MAGWKTLPAQPSSSAWKIMRGPRSTSRTSSANACPSSPPSARAEKRLPAPAGIYEVKVFSHGLHYSDIGAAAPIRDFFEATPLPAMPAPVQSDLPELPPRDTWVNIRALGAKGDGATDDTAIFKKAIAGNRAIYLPSGKYVVSDTLAL